jgi:hypothetical protein
MEMKMLFFIVLAVALVVLYLAFQTKYVTRKVTLGKVEIQAEVADTLPKQIKGLMFRKSLPEKSGMLFVFGSDDYYGIWMMNMSFPIDIIWIDSNHKIVDIVKDVLPCGIICPSYEPTAKARFVLEVNSGFTEKYSVKVGDTVNF